MRPVYAFVPGTEAAMRHIAQHLRAADRVELAATHPDRDIEAVLLASLATSRWCTVVTLDDEPALAYGVAPCDQFGVGLPWLLTTDRIGEVQREFLRRCRGEIALMQAGFSLLINCVHRDNAIALRWLEWSGFTVLHDQPNGELLTFFREI